MRAEFALQASLEVFIAFVNKSFAFEALISASRSLVSLIPISSRNFKALSSCKFPSPEINFVKAPVASSAKYF